MKYEVVKARPGHILQLAKTMRAADKAELLASTTLDVGPALLYILQQSTEAYTALVEGRVIAMFGVAKKSHLSDIHAPWMLSSIEAPKHWVHFGRQSKPIMAYFIDKYGYLENYVDGRYPLAMRWCEYVGFKIGEPVRVGDVDFYKITMKK